MTVVEEEPMRGRRSRRRRHRLRCRRQHHPDRYQRRPLRSVRRARVRDRRSPDRLLGVGQRQRWHRRPHGRARHSRQRLCHRQGHRELRRARSGVRRRRADDLREHRFPDHGCHRSKTPSTTTCCRSRCRGPRCGRTTTGRANILEKQTTYCAESMNGISLAQVARSKPTATTPGWPSSHVRVSTVTTALLAPLSQLMHSASRSSTTAPVRSPATTAPRSSPSSSIPEPRWCGRPSPQVSSRHLRQRRVQGFEAATGPATTELQLPRAPGLRPRSRVRRVLLAVGLRRVRWNGNDSEGMQDMVREMTERRPDAAVVRRLPHRLDRRHHRADRSSSRRSPTAT